MSAERFQNAQRTGSQSYRAYVNGRRVGDVMTDVELEAFERTIDENVRNGLADPDSELVIEVLGRNGWYVARTLSWGPPIFDREATGSEELHAAGQQEGDRDG